MQYDISFVVGFLSVVLHFVLVMHLVSCHHSHCIDIVFIKLASARSCRVPLAFVVRYETKWVFHSPLVKPTNLSQTPSCALPKLARTRTGLSLPMDPDYPQTSIKHLRFRFWTPYLFTLNRPISIGRTGLTPTLILLLYK